MITKIRTLVTVFAAMVVVGCASFSTNLFRAEQVATGAAYTAYIGYTNALANGTLKPSVTESNSIKAGRLNFAASVGVLEAYRLSYETNSTAKTAAQAALAGVLANSSNLVWLINHIEGK